jgi:ABC-type transport system involved in cytochrome c biogenesis permease subunit
MKLGPLIGSAVLIGSLLGGAAGLYFWKLDAIRTRRGRSRLAARLR